MERNIATSEKFMGYVNAELGKHIIKINVKPEDKSLVKPFLDNVQKKADTLCDSINSGERYVRIVLDIRELKKAVDSLLFECNVDGIITNDEYHQYEAKSEEFFSDLEKEYDESVVA